MDAGSALSLLRASPEWEWRPEWGRDFAFALRTHVSIPQFSSGPIEGRGDKASLRRWITFVLLIEPVDGELVRQATRQHYRRNCFARLRRSLSIFLQETVNRPLRSDGCEQRS